jgi:RNA polymerase sigma-70 factor (ECF subfamily)
MTDAESFEAFVRRYQDMVFATAIRLLGNAADAEDAAQTVFLRAFERYAQLAGHPAAGGWLKTTARNVCLNHLSRYRARWRFFSEMDADRETGESYEDGLESQVSRALEPLENAHLDRQERLERALHGLPDAQRVPLVLFHFEDLAYEDIARTLGVSLAKVKTDIHRGRQKLRQLLTDDGTR